MDHDTENDFFTYAVDATCQVCSFHRDFQNETIEQVQTEMDEWCMHMIDVVVDPKKPPLKVPVLTCPACAELGREVILERYKLRIREGADPRFH